MCKECEQILHQTITLKVKPDMLNGSREFEGEAPFASGITAVYTSHMQTRTRSCACLGQS